MERSGRTSRQLAKSSGSTGTAPPTLSTVRLLYTTGGVKMSYPADSACCGRGAADAVASSCGRRPSAAGSKRAGRALDRRLDRRTGVAIATTRAPLLPAMIAALDAPCCGARVTAYALFLIDLCHCFPIKNFFADFRLQIFCPAAAAVPR